METIKYGALYKENDNLKLYLPRYYESLNDQKYHLWIPIRVKKDETDKVYMIDTYQNYTDYGSYDEIVKKLKEYGEEQDNSWYANQVYNYYYSAKIELTEQTKKCFDFYIDLEEYKVLESRENTDFKDEDVVNHIQLYHEHAYPRGLMLVRKDAEIDYELKVDRLFRKMIYDELNPPFISSYSLSKLNELSEKVVNTKKIDVANELYFKLTSLLEEYKVYYKDMIEECKNNGNT